MKKEQTFQISNFISRFLLKSFICFVMIAGANTPGTSAQNIDIDPQLLDKFKFVNIDGEVLVEVSLQSLLSLALERATTMDIIAINQEIAKENYDALQNIYNPNLSTTIGMQRSVSASGTNMSGDVVSVYTGSAASFLDLQATDTTAFSTTWSKKTKSGILYSMGYQKASSQTNTGSYAEEKDDFSGWEKYDDPIYTDTFTTSVSIPLFQDWGDINKSPEYKGQIGVETTELQSQKSILQMLELVAGIYWDMVGVVDNIETLEASEKLSLQFVKDSKTRMQLGVLDPIEVKQSESRLLAVQQDLLSENFQKKQIEDQIKVALNLQDIPYGYRPSESLKQRPLKKTFDSLLKEVFDNDPDLALLQAQVKLNGIELREAQNKDRTDMDLSLKYKMNGYGKDINSASSSMSESKQHDYQVGLTWSVPLFDKQTPKNIRQKTLENQRLLLQLNDLKAQLKVGLQSILRSLELAEQGIKLATTSVELAKDLLDKETEKFNLGNNTSFRVSQVQQDLIDAQKNKTLAQVNYEKSYLKLLIITGKIFNEYDLPKQY